MAIVAEFFGGRLDGEQRSLGEAVEVYECPDDEVKAAAVVLSSTPPSPLLLRYVRDDEPSGLTDAGETRWRYSFAGVISH